VFCWDDVCIPTGRDVATRFLLLSEIALPPNPRLQRTPLRAPLSRKPLGGRLLVAAGALLAAVLGSGCEEPPTEPRPTAIFRVRDDVGSGGVFRVGIDNPTTIREAEELMVNGETRWVVGTVRAGAAGFNAPWHWHLDPATIRFQQTSIEQCQTSAGGVEDNLDFWIRFGDACVGGRVEARER
jgi:hypothetical protein